MGYKKLIMALSMISCQKSMFAADQEAFIAALIAPTQTANELAALLVKTPSLANTPLSIKQISTTPLRLAALQEKHNCQRVVLLLEHSADCNAILQSPREIHKNRTLLMDMADTPGIIFDRDTQEIFKRCLKEPIDFSLKDTDGATLLELLTSSAANPLVKEPYKSRVQELVQITKTTKKEQENFYVEWVKQARYTIISYCRLDEIHIAEIIMQYGKPSVYELHRLAIQKVPKEKGAE
jgi:hypothetical protein